MAIRKKDIKNTGMAKKYMERRHTVTQIKRCSIKSGIGKTDN